MNDFFHATRDFILKYLPHQRCLSENTIRSYKQVLNLFTTYLRKVKGYPVSKIQFSLLDRDTILGFLDWIESERKCGATTRNHRLMVLRSFFDFAGKSDCTQMALYLDALDIPVKKTQSHVVDFLSEPALAALLQQPNSSTKKGLRDMTFMVLMYDTAARCDELLNMKLDALRLDIQKPVAYLLGKGNKQRVVPLMSRTVQHCKRYISEFHNIKQQKEGALLFFTTSHGECHKMSADNVAVFFKKYGRMAQSVCAGFPSHIHPHMLRHTRAMHLYRGGMSLDMLSQFLGHADMETTRVYAYADTEMKRDAIAKLDKGHNIPEQTAEIWADNEDMILTLAGLR